MGSIISALISMLGVLIVFYKTREYQSNIQKEKLEEDAKNNQPVFIFDPLEIYYQFKGYKKKYIDKNWIYPDSNLYNDNLNNDFNNDYFHKSILRFRNIGNGVAKNVTITCKHIDGLNFLNQVNGDSYYPLNHDFKLGKVNDDNNEATISVELDENGDKGYSFRVRMKEKYSEKKYRFINNNGYIEFPFNLFDMRIFNYRLYHSDPREIREPMLQFTFEYYDLYDNPYKDTIYISINNMSLKHNHRDEITVMAKLDEVNEEYKVKADENIQSKLGHPKYFN